MSATTFPISTPEGEISSDELRQLFMSVLVIQPSPFCNIDCDYCYLPDRTSTQRMEFDTLRKVKAPAQRISDAEKFYDEVLKRSRSP